MPADARPQLPTFRRQPIYQGAPSERVLCLVGDLDGDGDPEIVIAARRPHPEIFWLDRQTDGRWTQHLIDRDFRTIEAGGALYDLDGDGKLDLMAGQDASGNLLFWWECPDDPTAPWTRREIAAMPGNQSHDQLVADLDDDGRPELYFWNQRAETLFWVPVPDDPRVEPWPHVEPVVTDIAEEGLAVADVDGDGQLELIAGQSWYRRASDGSWQRHAYAEGFLAPRVAAADFNGDGRVEIVIAEGDASLRGRAYGRLAICRWDDDPTRPWEVEILHDRLLDPHALQVADFTGDGRPDLFVGELGLPDGSDPHPPAQRVFVNRDGGLHEYVIDRGMGGHESRVTELDGRPAVVLKPYRSLRSELPRHPSIDQIHLLMAEADPTA